MAYPTNAEVNEVLRSRGYEFERFSFFPGTNPNVTAEEIAETVINALNSIANGEGRDIDLEL